MKLFYFGSLCSDETFEHIVKNSKRPPSHSAQNFEGALIKGLCETDCDLSVNSALSIAPFPEGCRLNIKRGYEQIGKTETYIIPMLNLPVIKQKCMSKGLVVRLKKWLDENRTCKDKCVITYGIYPPTAAVIQKLCKKYDCKCVAIIADIPRMMYTYTPNRNYLKRILALIYRRSAISLQSGFDAYVYLTEAMASEVGKDKPYIVIETVCDETAFDGEALEKSSPKAVMYAGALYKKYGLDLIVSSFLKVKGDYELWLFGDGDYKEEIKKAAIADKRIKFFGVADRKTILEYERKASLLVNIRSDEQEFTKFSFPSKTVEYMLSGTPTLTSRLDGIPDEYYDYVYTLDNTDVEKIALKIGEILEKDDDIGKAARNFVLENKNSRAQAEKLLKFLQAQTTE